MIDNEQNYYQITRIDGRNSFVESLWDSFQFSRFHLCFVSYDTSRPAGERQIGSVNIYIDAGDFLNLLRRLSSGELEYTAQAKKQAGDQSPLFEVLGGTSAEKLAKYGKPRPDRMSLSRTAQLLPGKKTDFLFVAKSGPGQQNEKGLIVPRFGNQPENRVSVPLTAAALTKLLALSEKHYEAWLTAMYTSRSTQQFEYKAN